MILCVLALTTTTGCHKDKPCKAIVSVIDANNNPVGGATVELDPNGTGPNVQIGAYTTSTDASGKASFETNLPKIMDIKVIFSSTTYTTGKVVRFEQGKTDEVTVQI